MACTSSSSVSVCRRGSAEGDPERTVLWLCGDHDIATNGSVEVSIAQAAKLDDIPLLIDLSAVTFMGASTLRAIVAGRNRLRSRGQSLELRAPSPPARRVLELCGFAHLIQPEPVHSTGGSAALATWVDVSPLAPAGRIDHGAGHGAATHGTLQSARALAGADVHVEETVAAGEVDRGGP